MKWPLGTLAAAAAAGLYAGTAAPTPNPDRGFRYELDQLLDLDKTKAQVAALREYNITVAQAYVYLPTTTPLPPPVLANLTAGFAYLRRVGMRALLRFAYDLQMPGEADYTFETIQAHIAQLAPVVQANSDALYVGGCGIDLL